MSCVFCEIVKRKSPADIVYEDDLVIAFLDIDPISDGHTIVIPKADVPDIHSLDEKTGGQIMAVAKQISETLIKEFSFDGTMIMEVNGPFQDVPHFHLHVFGRNKENDLKIEYPTGVSADVETRKKNAEKLRKYLEIGN